MRPEKDWFNATMRRPASNSHSDSDDSDVRNRPGVPRSPESYSPGQDDAVLPPPGILLAAPNTEGEKQEVKEERKDGTRDEPETTTTGSAGPHPTDMPQSSQTNDVAAELRDVLEKVEPTEEDPTTAQVLAEQRSQELKSRLNAAVQKQAPTAEPPTGTTGDAALNPWDLFSPPDTKPPWQRSWGDRPRGNDPTRDARGKGDAKCNYLRTNKGERTY